MERAKSLTPKEFEILKDEALRMFADDAANDPRYAAETVRHLAERAYPNDYQWWLEFMSSDPDVHEEILGFDPWE